MNNEQICTSNLLLACPKKDDFIWIKSLWQNCQVRKYLGGAVVNRILHKKMEELESHWNKHGFGQCSVFLKNTLEPIGLCGWSYSDENATTEIVYAFFPQYWGKGLTTEAVKACLEHGFSVYKFDRIIAITQFANSRSCRLLEKVGMQYVKTLSLFNKRQRMYEMCSHRNLNFNVTTEDEK